MIPMPQLARRSLASLLCALMVFQPMAATAQVIAATAAAAGARPTIDQAANGVPVVQIATPNGAGVSHNQYQQYNVDSRGVVLNNSQGVTATQQAGYIAGNPNLGAGTARIILNEVTSNLPSDLRGYTEVAGTKAEVILANPNGITCNGCGFINTSRGILTTGTPVFGGSGSLDAFRVTGGQILVEGNGLDGRQADQVDLIARSLAVNAGLWANTLNVVTGANRVAHGDLSATPVSGAGSAPAVAIDVAALGGMYAGKIRLLATEAGVGVNSLGRLAAQSGDFQLDAAGRVTLGGTVYATGTATLNSGAGLTNSGLLAAGGNLQLAAAEIDNTGTLAAGLDSQSQVTQAGTLTASAVGTLRSVGKALGGSDIRLSASAIDMTGAQTQAGGSVSLTASQGDINHTNGVLQSGGNLTFVASGAIVNDGGQLAVGQTLNSQSATLSNQGGQILQSGTGTGQLTTTGLLNNTNGAMASNGSLTLSVGSLNNQGGTLVASQDIGLSTGALTGNGTLLANRDLAISLDGNYTQSVTNLIQANRHLTFTLTGDLVNQGTLAAVDKLSITAANIDNQAGASLGGSTGQLSASQTFTNAGTVSATTLALNAATLRNTGSVFGNDVTVNAGTLTNQGTGVMAAGNSLNLYVTGTLNNLDGGLLYSAGRLAIAGANTRDANGWLDSPTQHILNRSASIQAGGDLEITATTLDNQRTNVVTDTRVLSSNIQLVQEKDGAWSGSTIGRTFINGAQVKVVTTTVTCDSAGNNCSSAVTTDFAGTGGVINLLGVVNWNIGTVVTGPVLDCPGGMLMPCNQVTTTVTTSVDQPYGYSYWHINEAASVPTFTILDLNQGGRRYSIVNESRQEYVVSATPESQVLAGGNLYLRAGTVNNIASRIEAAGNLVADVTTLNNTGFTLNNSTRKTTWTGQCSDIQGDEAGFLGSCRSGWIWTAGIANTITSTNTSLDSVFRGGQSLSLSAVTVNNRTVNAQGLPPGGINLTVSGTSYSASPYVFTVPAGGLYSLHTESTAHYLVETDPRFAQYANFISSDYMLNRLGLKLDGTLKRLGDGFYEQQLVREQLIKLKGTATLGQYASLNAEYQALLEAGTAYAQAFALAPGVTLTKEQVANLSQDMVWLEQRVVEGQTVLVPVVYLAASNQGRETGAILGGGAKTQISATDINNQGTISATGTTSLVATNNLTNDSGTIRGDNVTLAAGNDLHLGVATQSVTPYQGQTYTHEGMAGTVEGQSVTLSAGRDLTLAGGAIDAGTAALTAGRNLTVGTQTLSTEQHLKNGGSQYDRSATVERGSSITTTGSVSLTAARDLAVTGSVVKSGGDLSATAGNNLSLNAAYETDRIAYSAKNKKLSDVYQSSRSTAKTSTLEAGGNVTLQAGSALVAEGAEVKAAGDIALTAETITVYAAHDQYESSGSYSKKGKGSTQQAQSQIASDTARGSIIDAGGNLSTTTKGDTVIEGSALAAGKTATINTGGNLELLAAQSSYNAQISASEVGRKQATNLNYSQHEIRQLLTTITVGEGASLQVGGNFTAATGETRADGTLNADRMTANGVEKGDARQQVSVKRTGDGADANPSSSMVVGNLASQGIRNGANESFAATAANAVQSGQAALQQYMASGLLRIKADPQTAAQLTTLLQNNSGSTLTIKDDSGKLHLTVAGQAQVQAVYNTLQLTETFDKKKFADQQTAQIVTLVAAVALSVCAPGAGAAIFGASGTVTTAMANAAFISMSSTMVGQLAGGASFDKAFEAGVKAGSSAALSAGILNAPMFDTASGVQSINQWSGISDIAATGNRLAKVQFDQLGQTLAGIGLRSTVNAGVDQLVYGKQAGSFTSALTSGVVSDLAAVGANVIGQLKPEFSIENILGHAAVGGLAAKLKGKDALSGAIGGAGAAIINPVVDEAIGGADGSGWGDNLASASRNQSLTLQLTSMGVTGLIASAVGRDPLTAAQAAQNETVNNFLTANDIIKKYTRLSLAKSSEERAAILRYYVNVNRSNTAKALDGVDSSAMTVPGLEKTRADLAALLTGPITPSVRADVVNSIAEIDGILRSVKISATVDKYTEPVVLGITAVSLAFGVGEVIAARYALGGGLAGIGESVGEPTLVKLISGETRTVGGEGLAANDSIFNGARQALAGPTEKWQLYLDAEKQILNRVAEGAKGAVDSSLLTELSENGVKFTPENIVAAGRNSSGQVIFLETGTSKAGLQHIVDAHAEDFANIGVSKAQIPEVVMQAATQGKLVGYQGVGTGRPIYEITINGQPQRIAVTTGNNGFIVGANPAGGMK